MKLFQTSNIGIVKECQNFFDFLLPSVLLSTRMQKIVLTNNVDLLWWTELFCKLLTLKIPIVFTHCAHIWSMSMPFCIFSIVVYFSMLLFGLLYCFLYYYASTYGWIKMNINMQMITCIFSAPLYIYRFIVCAAAEWVRFALCSTETSYSCLHLGRLHVFAAQGHAENDRRRFLATVCG